ncbi:hypothetical protein BDM02DRAFT_392008 [Thelephora ganbajun]|uniref:Uncharacterized protein n=1 Tax=Thelephora ganbajun TaxID=370292 RepID=A0ACB6Z8N0_THEGA|nr:hypothetical protein BDM02DRAFT_392008 [Thelephora ganbajun]
MSTSIAAGQTVELREEPRQFIVSSQSSVYPTKAMAFASDDDEPPAYINDLPRRTRDHYSRTRTPRDGTRRNLNGIPSVYSPPPSRGRDFGAHAQTTTATTEIPLRPNRREDPEFGREEASPTSRVLLPVSANSKPKRTKSSAGNPAKNWLRNIKSPIDMIQ